MLATLVQDYSAYTLSTFRQVAIRRCAECRLLAADPTLAKQRDGAVVCALLAAECALKALLLRDHGQERVDDLPDAVKQGAFKGAAGHRLAQLYGYLSDPLKARCSADVSRAIGELTALDRYLYRYGGVSSGMRAKKAAEVVTKAAYLVTWMEAEL